MSPVDAGRAAVGADHPNGAMTHASGVAVHGVLVVDDDEAFCATTARILVRSGFACAVASSGATARAALDADAGIVAVLCDVLMPGESGIDLVAGLTADFPDLAVIMTTAIDDPAVADLAFASGAFGYVVKPFDTNELLISLASALRRRQSDVDARHQMKQLEHTQRMAATGGRPPSPSADGQVGAVLTRREHEVLGLIVTGLANKEIAQELGLRLNTVRNHVQNVLYKLGAHTKLEAVATAVRENVIAYPRHTAS